MLTLALLFALWIIFKAAQRIVQQYKHLTDEEVKDVMLNRIDRYGAQYSRIIRHLGLCESCQNRLHNYKEEDYIEDHLID